MDCTICVAKTKELISFAVTAKLICVFVFAYAKSQFSHNEAHIQYRWWCSTMAKDGCLQLRHRYYFRLLSGDNFGIKLLTRLTILFSLYLDYL